MKYQKSRISINEQIALLTENKGLKCSDQSELERALVEANHYRLSAYWFPYKTKCKSGITIFREGTTFETIIYTYEFDRALRQLMFDAVGSAVGRIEIYLRSRIAYLASEERGPLLPRCRHNEAQLGMPVELCAALGYAAVFGSATNTLLAPILIGCEIFGFGNLPAFFIVCVVAYLFNMDKSIYALQERA